MRVGEEMRVSEEKGGRESESKEGREGTGEGY